MVAVPSAAAAKRLPQRVAIRHALPPICRPAACAATRPTEIDFRQIEGHGVKPKLNAVLRSARAPGTRTGLETTSWMT